MDVRLTDWRLYGFGFRDSEEPEEAEHQATAQTTTQHRTLQKS